MVEDRNNAVVAALDRVSIRHAIIALRSARDLLVRGGASARCVDRVRRAIDSAEGAERHAANRAAPASVLALVIERGPMRGRVCCECQRCGCGGYYVRPAEFNGETAGTCACGGELRARAVRP